MDAQTQLVAELYKTLNDAQKQEVLSMIDTLLSQQLNDQQSLDFVTLAIALTLPACRFDFR